MARGRFISNTLELDDDTQRLMYVLMLTHTDVEGRLKGNARWLAGKAFTYLNYTHAQIEAALARMHAVGLIRWYTIKGRKYVQVEKFHDHNKVRKDRESGSVIPAPPEDAETPSQTNAGGLREDSGSTPSQVEVEVEVEVQDEVEGASSEERMARAFETGQPQANEQHRVRSELRHLAGTDFVKRHAGWIMADLLNEKRVLSAPVESEEETRERIAKRNSEMMARLQEEVNRKVGLDDLGVN